MILMPIVMDGIKTKKLVENAEMDFAELMYQIVCGAGQFLRRYNPVLCEELHHGLRQGFTTGFYLQTAEKTPVYVQADMDIYEYFKAQGVKIESTPRKCSQGTIAVISIRGARARSRSL